MVYGSNSAFPKPFNPVATFYSQIGFTLGPIPVTHSLIYLYIKAEFPAICAIYAAPSKPAFGSPSDKKLKTMFKVFVAFIICYLYIIYYIIIFIFKKYRYMAM